MLLAPQSSCAVRGAQWKRLAAVGVLLAACVAGWAQQGDADFNDLAARAAAARDQNNLPLAVQLYSQAEQVRPDWQEGWWYLGVLHYSANKYAEAKVAFDHLLQLAPHAVPAMALRGLCEYELESYDDALRDLDLAVAHGAANQPQNEQIIRYHLAQLLTRAGRFQDALAQYKIFATEHVKAPEMLVGLGLAGMRMPLLTKDAPAQSVTLLEQAGTAGYALLAGDTQSADEQFHALFKQYPTTPNLHLFYGFLLFPHDPDLATGQFQEEVAVAPQNNSARALLAFTQMIAGQYADAIPQAQKVLTAEPGMEMAQLALGRSLVETGQQQQGMDLLNRVLQNDPDNLEAHMGLASAYAQLGRNEDAYRERMVCLKLAN